MLRTKKKGLRKLRVYIGKTQELFRCGTFSGFGCSVLVLKTRNYRNWILCAWRLLVNELWWDFESYVRYSNIQKAVSIGLFKLVVDSHQPKSGGCVDG
jgi:hypothetical protein